MRIVIGCVAASHHQVDGHLCGSKERFPQHLDLRRLRAFLPGGSRRLPSAAGKSERGLLGVGNQSLAIHRVRIVAAQVAELAAFFRAGAHFGGGDILKHGPQRVE